MRWAAGWIALAFAICAPMVPAHAANMQKPPAGPCRASEPQPGADEANPAVRGAVLTIAKPAPHGRAVSAQACAVLGPLAAAAPFGVLLNWNMALLGPGGSLAEVFGAQTDPVKPPPPGKDGVAIPLRAAWSLGPEQIQPVPDSLLAEVATMPCHDESRPYCGASADETQYATILLHPKPPLPAAGTPAQAPPPDACLAPVDPAHDPAFRQITVIAEAGIYRVIACVVSAKFASLALAHLDFDLRAADGSAAAAYADGNTRLHIGPLLGGDKTMPRVVTLMAVGIPPKDPAAALPPVLTANVTFEVQGCEDAAGGKCSDVQSTQAAGVPVRFETAGQQ